MPHAKRLQLFSTDHGAFVRKNLVGVDKYRIYAKDRHRRDGERLIGMVKGEVKALKVIELLEEIYEKLDEVDKLVMS